MKANLILIAVILFGLSACSNLDDLLTFRINHTVNMEIPAASPVNLPVEIPTPQVTTNSQQAFENNNTNASLVKDVKLEDIQLTITQPSNKNFNFLKSIQLYIATDEQSEILLAHLDEIPVNVSSISLTATTQKLDAFVKSSRYQIRTSIVTKETLTQDIDVRADLVFKVTAEPM
jgi:hypothetical protein